MAFGPLLKLVDHLKSLDADTIALLTRFVLRGVKSGDLNAFVKGHLGHILDDDGPGPPKAVTARVVPSR